MLAAMTKIVAWSAMAMAGTAAKRQSRVLHSRMATTITQTPMTISVLPMCDHTRVISFQVEVRPEARSLLTDSSSRESPMSGPVRANPIPTISPQSAMPGPTARVRRSRPSSL